MNNSADSMDESGSSSALSGIDAYIPVENNLKSLPRKKRSSEVVETLIDH